MSTSSSSTSSKSSSSSSKSSSSSTSYVKNWSSSSSSNIENWSSSSSSDIGPTIDLRTIVVNQNNNTLLPFSFISERGHGNDSNKLDFTITATNSSNFDYEAIINRDNSYFTTTLQSEPTVYVPQDNDSYYEHRSSFHVDIISSNPYGIKQVRTHTEPNAYEFEDPEYTFKIPKFTWDTDTGTTTTTTTPLAILENTFWTADGNALYNVQYTRSSSTLANTIVLGPYINNVVLSKNRMYVSTNSKYIYYSNDVYSSYREVTKKVEADNSGGIISLHHNGYVWSVNSYLGTLSKLNEDDLTVITNYTGLDAPFKILWSEFHNCYFVAGSYILWKLTTTLESVYEINDFRIIDFTIAEEGTICLILDGLAYDIIRVIKSDLYTLLLNQKIENSDVKFCQYCEEGRFYILTELSTNGDVYSSDHYVYNSKTNVLEQISSQEALSTTTTTTTLATVTDPIIIEYPIGGEQLQKGETYTIRWASNKGYSDLVKIELYKKGALYSVIAEETGNTGVYSWKIPTNYKDDDRYRVKITWLTPSEGSNDDESPADFEITTLATITTTTTTPLITDTCIGVDYDSNNDQVVLLLKSGLAGFFALDTLTLYGLVDTTFKEVHFLTNDNVRVGRTDKQTKVRIFVGSQEGWSNLWDSGEIETSLTSMFYGGSNLVAGKKYYVNIQICVEDEEWSSVASGEFVMPR